MASWPGSETVRPAGPGQELSPVLSCTGEATPQVLCPLLNLKKDIEGLECVQGKETELRKRLEHSSDEERLRELGCVAWGKVAVYNSLKGGVARPKAVGKEMPQLAGGCQQPEWEDKAGNKRTTSTDMLRRAPWVMAATQTDKTRVPNYQVQCFILHGGQDATRHELAVCTCSPESCIKSPMGSRSGEEILPLYSTLMRPHPEFCIHLWDPQHRKDMDQLK
ncbi:hypothetical protein TURU_067758 [Turdus rufiventris]|nr:hypothetical protein TURU_067758 [Turdus rufiventris]